MADLRFEQGWVQPGAEPVVVEFEIDADAFAVALDFETAFADRGRLERLGDLPEGW